MNIRVSIVELKSQFTHRGDFPRHSKTQSEKRQMQDFVKEILRHWIDPLKNRASSRAEGKT
jgi:hypothetical protein